MNRFSIYNQIQLYLGKMAECKAYVYVLFDS